MSERTIRLETIACIHCNKTSFIDLPVDGYQKWLNGKGTLEAFPSFDADQRELLISGIHAECWNKIFS